MKHAIPLLLVATVITACQLPKPNANRQPSYVTNEAHAAQLTIGMTTTEAQMVMGQPEDVRKQMTEAGTNEVWIYATTVSNVNFFEGLSRSLQYATVTAHGGDANALKIRDQIADAELGRTKQKLIYLGFVNGILKIVEMK